MEFTREWFTEASKEWMKNKRKKRGCYFYTCDHTYQSGKRCGRDCFKQEVFCQQHWALAKNKESKQVKIITTEYILVQPDLSD